MRSRRAGRSGAAKRHAPRPVDGPEGGLLPVGPALFRVRWSRSLEERIRIEFDPDDRVTSVSRVVEEAGTDAGG